MKKFNFRLQKILELRKIKEEEAQRLFAKKEAEKLEKEKKIIDVDEQQKNIVNLQKSKKGKIDVAYYRNFYSFLSSKKIEKNNLQLELFNSTKEFHKFREDYLAKMRDRKILESLKEKKRLQHKKEYLREEQKMFDDIANRKKDDEIL